MARLPPEETSSLVIAQKVLEPILSPLTTLGIILAVVIFLLMQCEDLRDRTSRPDRCGASQQNRLVMPRHDV